MTAGPVIISSFSYSSQQLSSSAAAPFMWRKILCCLASEFRMDTCVCLSVFSPVQERLGFHLSSHASLLCRQLTVANVDWLVTVARVVSIGVAPIPFWLEHGNSIKRDWKTSADTKTENTNAEMSLQILMISFQRSFLSTLVQSLEEFLMPIDHEPFSSSEKRQVPTS